MSIVQKLKGLKEDEENPLVEAVRRLEQIVERLGGFVGGPTGPFDVTRARQINEMSNKLSTMLERIENDIRHPPAEIPLSPPPGTA